MVYRRPRTPNDQQPLTMMGHSTVRLLLCGYAGNERLDPQLVTTKDSLLSPLAAQQLGSPSIQRDGQPASPSSTSSASETPIMSGQPPIQPLSLEEILMNLQTSIATIQQRAAQTDDNITHLNDLFDTRLPPAIQKESEAEEDVHTQPIMVEDLNNPGRLIVQPNHRVVRAPAANPNPVGDMPNANPDITALVA
ncbi:hypothetical protein RHMOL_Rhmol11G0005600 [Rhododendron molle]|uniref:Uncharacterized protein n=1 Tax=Rhododendron molle TaxID=49168 RepID=A0ACC0LMC3_RHOML|nr:hypothetical protein RHMOL_Rhmol11G0005600 [Rhododendron molle]